MQGPTDAQVSIACELALGGDTQREIAQKLGVHPSTIGRWKLEHPLFGQKLRRAQEEGSIARVDRVKEIVATEENVHRARVVSDVERWALERQYRQLWGASVDINLTERIDVGGALIEARKRSALPISNLAQLAQAQDTEYTMLKHKSATDNESAAAPEGFVNPFD